MRIAIAGPTGVLGPGTFQERTATRLLNRTQKVPCDGRNFVSLVHLKDMASACALVLVHPTAGAILNINAEPLRQGTYFDRLSLSVGGTIPERDFEHPCPPSFRCSNLAVRKILGWEPVHGLYPGEL